MASSPPVLKCENGPKIIKKDWGESLWSHGALEIKYEFP